MLKPLLKKLIREVLSEEYPQNFSMEEFNKIPSYKAKFKYANERLRKLASGSARIIFQIDDHKVLKLAKNEKGLAQNNIETDGYFKMQSIVAEIFDYDDVHDKPYWVEMELAKKIKPSRFKQILGFSIDDLHTYLMHMRSVHTPSYFSARIEDNLKQKMDESEWVQDLMRIILDMDMSFPGDFGRLSTYGEVTRNGKLEIVVIDYGLTNSVYQDYYAR